jgi:hypothetical protein
MFAFGPSTEPIDKRRASHPLAQAAFESRRRPERSRRHAGLMARQGFPDFIVP